MLILLLAPPASAQSRDDFAYWDANGNGNLTCTEALGRDEGLRLPAYRDNRDGTGIIYEWLSRVSGDRDNDGIDCESNNNPNGYIPNVQVEPPVEPSTCSADAELRAWGVAHAPLWAALRARTFAVHVVAVGLGADAADRAAPLLKYWTQDGDGTGVETPTGPTQADPDIRQEIAHLKGAITGGDRTVLAALGGFRTAVHRLKALRQLPEGTPTTTKARVAIDRFQIWSTSRLTGPEAAI